MPKERQLYAKAVRLFVHFWFLLKHALDDYSPILLQALSLFPEFIVTRPLPIPSSSPTQKQHLMSPPSPPSAKDTLTPCAVHLRCRSCFQLIRFIERRSFKTKHFYLLSGRTTDILENAKSSIRFGSQYFNSERWGKLSFNFRNILFSLTFHPEK